MQQLSISDILDAYYWHLNKPAESFTHKIIKDVSASVL